MKYYKNQGFTLVEFLLAMALGIFLIAGISTVYISSKKTYAVRDQTSELDENARVALRALKQHIEHAGYASTTGMLIPGFILPTGTTVVPEVCADGSMNVRNTAIISASADRAAANGGDTIGLTYLSDPELSSDCTGTEIAAACLPPDSANRAASYVYNSFAIGSSRNNATGDPIPELRCGGSLNRMLQPWAEGIENMQFQYGVDSDADGAVDRYWNATTLESEGAWENIMSVRVGLLVRSVDPVFDRAVAESFQVLDQVVNTSDRYRRGVYTTVIRLKNVARRI